MLSEGISVHQFFFYLLLLFPLFYFIFSHSSNARNQPLALILLFLSILVGLSYSLYSIILQVSSNDFYGQNLFLLPRIPSLSWFVLYTPPSKALDATSFSWSVLFSLLPYLSISLRASSVYYAAGSWRWSLHINSRKFKCMPVVEAGVFWIFLVFLFSFVIPGLMFFEILSDSFWLTLSYASMLALLSIYVVSASMMMSSFASYQSGKISAYDQRESSLLLSPQGIGLRAEQLSILTDKISAKLVPRLVLLSLFILLEAIVFLGMACSCVKVGLDFSSNLQRFIPDLLHSCSIVLSSVYSFVMIEILFIH